MVYISFRKKFRTRESEYLFFLSCKARMFFPENNIRLYDKNSESDYFFFLHQNQNLFFSNIGNQNIFLEKKPYPPWKLNGPSLIHFVIFTQPHPPILKFWPIYTFFFSELYIFFHYQIVFYLGLYLHRNTVYVFTLK